MSRLLLSWIRLIALLGWCTRLINRQVALKCDLPRRLVDYCWALDPPDALLIIYWPAARILLYLMDYFINLVLIWHRRRYRPIVLIVGRQ